MLTSLTMKDELFNPFDRSSDEVLYLQPQLLFSTASTEFAAAEPLAVDIQLMLANEMVVQERVSYSVWDAVCDVGGLSYGLVFLLSPIMSMYSSAWFRQSVI